MLKTDQCFGHLNFDELLKVKDTPSPSRGCVTIPYGKD
jgi:hypothetical protein